MNMLAAATQTESMSAEMTEAVTTAGAVGGVVAFTLTTFLLFALVWFILQVVADWKIFSKAGEAGWKSIIPIYSTYVEYDICWNGLLGLLFVVLYFIFSWMSPGEGAPMWRTVVSALCGIVALILHLMQSMKLSKAFGHGIGFGIVLFLFGPIGRIILGFGGSEYVGRPE